MNISELSAKRIANTVYRLSNAIQDAPCSTDEKIIAVTCFVSDLLEVYGEKGTTISSWLTIADNVKRTSHPEFRACEQLIQNNFK